MNTLEWIGPAPVFNSGTSLWHDRLTKIINGHGSVEAKSFYSDSGRQMELVSDYSSIPFEEIKMIGEDIRSVFALSEYIDEERIEAILKAMQIRIEELRKMALEHKSQKI